MIKSAHSRHGEYRVTYVGGLVTTWHCQLSVSAAPLLTIALYSAWHTAIMWHDMMTISGIDITLHTLTSMQWRSFRIGKLVGHKELINYPVRDLVAQGTGFLEAFAVRPYVCLSCKKHGCLL